jgi:NAD(P)-dependent dehydrogenase (short-subunit alcohol dehydrogenase family)
VSENVFEKAIAGRAPEAVTAVSPTSAQGRAARISTSRTHSEKRLAGKVVIVTGSGAGIGRVIAVDAARQGANVVINGRRRERLEAVEEEIGRIGSDSLAIAADLRNADDVAGLVEQVRERFGAIDVLVNNAGGRFLAEPEDISPNGWRAVVETNLTAAFLCCRAVLPVMRERGGGRIINIGSMAGEGAYPEAVHYGAAKAGLVSLTASLAVAWAKYNVQVNCVSPGAILTDASRFADPVLRAEVEEAQPGGRIGTPEEIAEVVLFLAGMSGTYVTGQTINVDGARQVPLPVPR